MAFPAVVYTTAGLLLHSPANDPHPGRDPRRDHQGSPRDRAARPRADRAGLDRPPSRRRDPRLRRWDRSDRGDRGRRLPRRDARAPAGRRVRPAAGRDDPRHHARAAPPAARHRRLARGTEPLRAARAHDPRHLGLRRARRQQPPGARDVERRRPPARHPCRRAGVPDRAPALRRERGLCRPLQGARVAVSAVPGFMALLGLTIEHADAEEAVVRMDVPDALMSPFGAVHGGFIAALLDTGFGIALHRRLDAADRIATHSLNVTYVAFSREQLLFCRTRVLSLRKAVAVVEGEVTTGDGTLVAKALGTFGVRRRGAGPADSEPLHRPRLVVD